ncbi:MAG: nucleotidyltransferase domain-containing protein [Sphingomonas sp.]
MSLRHIPDSFSAPVVAAIDERLSSVEAEHEVRIALAIESGSRAWGFPSPDSDYDCRFVFIRPVEQYLSPWVRRDVIETPLDAVLDVNGWDLGKALKLLLKGNAVIIEWLRSPLVYRGDAGFRDEMLAFATEFADRDLIARHYLHLGERQRHTYFGDGKDVALKKIFYALRPAATLRWLRLRPGEAIAPMHFPTLMASCEPPADVVAVVSDLMARKAQTRELGSAPLPEPIHAFMDTEFDLARIAFEKGPVRLSADAVAAAEVLFRRHAWHLGSQAAK